MMLVVLALYLAFVVFNLSWLYQCFEFLWTTTEVPREINILLRLALLYLVIQVFLAPVNLLLEIRARRVRQANLELFRRIFGIQFN